MAAPPPSPSTSSPSPPSPSSLHSPTPPTRAGAQTTTMMDLRLQLTNERLHLEQSRIDHATLRSSYHRLVDELSAVRDELKSVVEDRNRAVSRYKCHLEECRRNVNDKHDECEKCQLNGERVELMRNEIYEEAERLLHLKLEQMSSDLQNARHDFNRVSHELSLCEAELDQEKQEKLRAIEDLKRRQDSQLSCWKKENERLRQTKILGSTHEQLSELQMENAQLRRKIKELIIMVPESDAVDQMAPEATTTQRSIAGQKTQFMQSKENLRMNRKEVDGEELKRLLEEIHQLQKDRTVLKRQVGELKTKFQLNISSLRLEMMTGCRELERRVEEEQRSLNAGNDELKMWKTEMAAERDNARTRSHELKTQLNEERKHFECIQNEKAELERKLATIDRRRVEEEEEERRQMETMQQRLTNSEREKEEAERQADAYRVQSESQQQLLSKAQSDYSSMIDLRLELSSLNDRRQSSVRDQLENVRRLSAELQNARTQLVESEAAWTRDRQQMQTECEDFRRELARVTRQSISNLTFYKGRLKVWNILEKKLKQNLQVLRSELSKLEIDKGTGAYEARPEALASDSSTERTRRQLCQLMEKHRRFGALLFVQPTTAAYLRQPEAVNQSEERCSPDKTKD